MTRLTPSGIVLDPTPISYDVNGPGGLGDIGFRDGVFYVLGTTDVDGGSRLWVWRIGQGDAGVNDAFVIDSPNDVGAVAAGPASDAGTLIFAYTRKVFSSPWRAPRLYLASVGDDLVNGQACGRHSDCASRVCVGGVCCSSVAACTIDAGAIDAGAADAGTLDSGGSGGGGLSADAGVPDASFVEGPDAGGATTPDAGAAVTSDSSSEVDGGARPRSGRYRVGCGCRAPGESVLALGLFALAALVRRRPSRS